MKIEWTDFAKNEIREIFQYYKLFTTDLIAKKIVKNITISAKKLIINPELGQIEEYLTHIETFRYIVESHFKIIYFIDHEQNKIFIIDIFDTRQNETKLTRNIL